MVKTVTIKYVVQWTDNTYTVDGRGKTRFFDTEAQARREYQHQAYRFWEAKEISDLSIYKQTTTVEKESI